MIPLLPPYHGFSKYYDLVFSKADYDADVRAINLILKGCGIQRGKLLDLGCGTGQHAIRLARMGYKVIGIDSSYEMIRKAGEKARSAKVDVEFVVSDMKKFATDERFDGILCLFGSFSHLIKLEDVRTLFLNTSRLLRNGGVFIFDFINKDGARRGWKEWSTWTEGNSILFLLDEFHVKRKEGILSGDYTFIAIRDGKLEDIFKERHTFKLYTREEIGILAGEFKFHLHKFCSTALQVHSLREARERDYMIRAITIKIT